MTDSQQPADEKPTKPPGLTSADHVLLWISLAVWVVIFLAGTLIDSTPYRESLASLEGDPVDLIRSSLIVVTTYTYTNVAILCLFAGLLGTLARRSQLGTDELRFSARDSINPRSSAILRGFLVYLALIAGVLILGDEPAAPTQKGYVRLAGLISLLSYVVNARPRIVGKLLRRVGDTFESGPD